MMKKNHSELLTLCSWCQGVIFDGPTGPRGEVSHGICYPCAVAGADEYGLTDEDLEEMRKEQGVAKKNPSTPTLFHVTYLHALPTIMRQGLLPGRGGHFGGGYREHSKGKIFLCEADGVEFWVHRLENVANDLTDHPEEGWVPIPLAVDVTGLPLVEDKLGTVDSREPAYFVKEPVEPERLSYLDGTTWRGIEDAEPEYMMDDVLAASEFVPDEPGSETGYWEIEYEYFLLTDEELAAV